MDTNHGSGTTVPLFRSIRKDLMDPLLVSQREEETKLAHLTLDTCAAWVLAAIAPPRGVHLQAAGSPFQITFLAGTLVRNLDEILAQLNKETKGEEDRDALPPGA